jgi:hypothetical protein
MKLFEKKKLKSRKKCLSFWWLEHVEQSLLDKKLGC